MDCLYLPLLPSPRELKAIVVCSLFCLPPLLGSLEADNMPQREGRLGGLGAMFIFFSFSKPPRGHKPSTEINITLKQLGEISLYTTGDCKNSDQLGPRNLAKLAAYLVQMLVIMKCSWE